MSEHYYTQNPTSKVEEKTILYTVKDVTLKVKSVSGVFGYAKQLDKASLQLISHFDPTGCSILDMGCGYGAIGLSVKALFPDYSVTMCDINKRAVAYANKNAADNHLDVRILESNLFSSLDGHVYDDILSNPPISVGKSTNYALIEQSYEHLTANGALWLVAYHNKGGSTLQTKMMETFGNVEAVSKSGGIRVYKSRKSD